MKNASISTPKMVKFKSDFKSKKNNIYIWSYHKIRWEAVTWWLQNSKHIHGNSSAT